MQSLLRPGSTPPWVARRRGRDVDSAAAMQHGPPENLAQAVVPSRDVGASRVVFLESSVGVGVCGVTRTAIPALIPHLDRSRWEPALVLAEPKPSLQLAGVPVHVLTPR